MLKTTTHTIKTTFRKLLADVNTPVSIYLRLRDKFPNSILLESSDYHGNENSFSFICCEPYSSIKVANNILTLQYPNEEEVSKSLEGLDLSQELNAYIQSFSEEDKDKFNFISNGLFGYMSYDAVKYFENVNIEEDKYSTQIPSVFYSLYRFVIAINHFKNEMYIFNHSMEGSEDATNELEKIEYLIKSKDFPDYKFSVNGTEQSNFTDEEFLKALEKVKIHNHRGDVFQMVLSRKFSQEFQGDEFNVYRALRSINPSPYLFYFDYGSFKILGSSPEAQLVIHNHKATIYPIAGTFRRTGNDKEDEALAEVLKGDPKENAEHVMLVDLARNDLSRNCDEVEVERFREIQFYSHVIHLVSRVTGTISPDRTTMKVVADTFPAGTLTGAPKFKAMELISKYEKGNRGFYGGCIGFMGFNGDFNHAIMIRSFLSKDNVLYYQAGAGIVDDSVIQSELLEVNNKLMALKSAIEIAENI